MYTSRITKSNNIQAFVQSYKNITSVMLFRSPGGPAAPRRPGVPARRPSEIIYLNMF